MVAFGQFVDRFNGGHVRNTAFPEVNDDFFGVMEHVELYIEHLDGTKEQGAVDLIVLDALCVDVLSCPDPFGIVPCENQCRDDDPDQYGQGQVVEKERYQHHHAHHYDIRNRVPVQNLHTHPFKSPDGHHDHKPGQSCHGYLFDKWGPEHYEQ